MIPGQQRRHRHVAEEAVQECQRMAVPRGLAGMRVPLNEAERCARSSPYHRPGVKAAVLMLMASFPRACPPSSWRMASAARCIG